MTTVDTKGIIRYEASDSASPLHTALNLGLNSVSNALNAPGYLTRAGVHTVSGLSGLNTLRTQLDNAGYTGAAYAHRTDLGELWYHPGTGGSWGAYIPPLLTGSMAISWGTESATLQLTKDPVTKWVTMVGGSGSGTPSAPTFSLGTIPTAFRPKNSTVIMAFSSGSANANFRQIKISSTLECIFSGTLTGGSGSGGSGVQINTGYVGT